MRPSFRIAVLCFPFMGMFPFCANAQDGSRWRISPENISIRVGEDRRLQVLDDLAQELDDAAWSVDDPALADLREEGGRAVLHAKAVGTVRLSATLGEQTRSIEIRIWADSEPLPLGTLKWRLHDIGLQIDALPPVPTGAGPSLFSLEQTTSGHSYLRAEDDDGIQAWVWSVPEKTTDVKLVCGDNLGGVLVSANRADSFTIYAVGNDGKIRWQETIPGIRKGYTLHSGLFYLLVQSPDATTAHVTAIDEATGEHKFELELPASSATFVSEAKDGAESPCQAASRPKLRGSVSGLFGNTDGYTYLAFTESSRTLRVPDCIGLATSQANQKLASRYDDLVLWQIHSDGTYRSTIIEGGNTFAASATMALPTGAIIPDASDGVLLSVRVSHDLYNVGPNAAEDEFVYRIDPDGNVVYKFPLPKYAGPLHDGMVIGQGNRVAFVTRGGILLAFEIESGKELWRWSSGTLNIEVFAALANGDCLVQTPTALVEVKDSTDSHELVKGHKFRVGWQGQLYRIE